MNRSECLDDIYLNNLLGADIINIFSNYQDTVCPKKVDAKKIMVYLGSVGVASWRVFTPFMELCKWPGFDVAVSNFYPRVSVEGRFEDLDWADTLYFQRCVDESIFNFVRRAKEREKRIIFDTDDYMHGIPAHHPSKGAIESSKYGYWMDKMIEVCDVMTVSTQYLKTLYEKKYYGKKIVVLPNCINKGNWEMDKINRDTINIGWGGSSTHFEDIQTVTPVLIQLFEENEKLRLVCLNYPGVDHQPKYRDAFEGIPMRKRTTVCGVHPHREGQNLNMMDIGIAPLLDNDFNRAKSNVKFLAYSMGSIPTVATNLEPYQDTNLIKIKGNRFNSWYKALQTLIKDADYRKSLGKLAKKEVLSKYDIDNNLHLWMELLK